MAGNVRLTTARRGVFTSHSRVVSAAARRAGMSLTRRRALRDRGRMTSCRRPGGRRCNWRRSSGCGPELCATVLQTARQDKAWDVVAVTERALGVAAMTLNEVDPAIEHLRSAVAAGQRSGSKPGRRRGTDESGFGAAVAGSPPPRRSARSRPRSVSSTGAVGPRERTCSTPRSCRSWGATPRRSTCCAARCRCSCRSGDAEWEVRVRLFNRSLMHVAGPLVRFAEADLVAALDLCVQHGLEFPAGPGRA